MPPTLTMLPLPLIPTGAPNPRRTTMSSTDPLRSIAEQLSLFRLPEAPVPVTPAGSEGLLQFGTRIVPYRLRRRARARLALVIADHGLRINAPSTLPLRDIEAFAHQHGEWIVRKLDQQATAPRPQQLVIADGTRLPLLGAEAIVRVLPGHNRTRWIGNTLVIEAPEPYCYKMRKFSERAGCNQNTHYGWQ